MSERPLWKTNPQEWVEKMLVCAQRTRSILQESMGHMEDEHFLSTIHPWLFGEKCIIPVLSKMTMSSRIAPGEIFNLASVLSRCPALWMQMSIEGIDIPRIEEIMEWMGEIDAMRESTNERKNPQEG